MKNLKKVLALVVVFSMMLCSVAFASFPDVAEDADYAVAVNTLAALGIVSGDDQGNFNPDNTITRAEFTKIVCEIQGLKGDANKGVTPFTDVPADHWASGYINMATNLGVINGMGDGTFAPEAPVTYEQAIKMLVVTLGFAPMAEQRGGYPTGHLVVAQQYGLNKGVAAPAQADAAKRSTIAQVVNNALDTPMMEQTGWGNNISYEVKDGNNGRDRITLLSSKFDVVKLGGVVKANERDAIEGSALEGEIAFRYDEDYKTATKYALGNNASLLLSNVKIGDTEADEFYGLRVIAYIRDTGRGEEVVAIVAEEGKNVVKAVELADLDVDSGRTDIITAGKKTLAFYESETANKSVKYAVEDSVAVIVNGAYDNTQDLADIVTARQNDEIAKLELVDWDADGKFDLVKISKAYNHVVKSVEEDIYTIELMDGSALILDPEDEDKEISIESATGEELTFADIKEGDVIVVYSDDANAGVNYTSVINVVVLGQTAVEGTVRSKSTGVVTKVRIGDATYEIDAACLNAGSINVGAEGIFYLGAEGQIIAFDGSKASAGDYGIILEANRTTDWGTNSHDVKILDAEGKISVYAIDDELTINAGLNEDEFTNDEVIPANYFDGTVFAGLDNQTRENFFQAIRTTATALNVQNRLVQFKATSDAVITEITAVAAPTVATADYNATSTKLAGLGGNFNSSTLFFQINKNDIAKSKVIALDTLIDEAQYTIAAYNVEDRIVEAAIVLDGGASLDGVVKGWAVVVDVARTTDAEGEEAYEITFIENEVDEEKTILVSNEATEVDRDYNSGSVKAEALVAAMDAGSVFYYAANAEGVATSIASIANIGDEGYEFAAGMEAYTSTEVRFVAGLTAGKLTTDLALINAPVSEIDVTAAANQYRFEAGLRTNDIHVGSYKGGNVKQAIVSGNNVVEANYIFARVVDGEATDIISIDERAKDNGGLERARTAAADVTPANVTGSYTTYNVVASNGLTAVRVNVATDVAAHANANGVSKKWTGFAVKAPAGATQFKYAFGNNAMSNLIALETAVAAGQDGVALYYDAENPAEVARVQWFDANGDAVSTVVTFDIVTTLN